MYARQAGRAAQAAQAARNLPIRQPTDGQRKGLRAGALRLRPQWRSRSSRASTAAMMVAFVRLIIGHRRMERESNNRAVEGTTSRVGNPRFSGGRFCTSPGALSPGVRGAL